ncbi:MAG: fasciclin domain-containing protein [Novosphingobium sp.]|nr:fasciclin domain-containing protein [Novosphingobium sp.]
MKAIVTLMAATAMIGLSACDREDRAPAEDDVAAVDAAETPAATAAAGNSMVGGAEMFADKPIATNAAAAPNLTTLVTAVTQAGLGETLAGPGPFTVFAPTNDAFGKVDKATLDGLMAPAGKDNLTKVLTYHVVPGKMTAADLAAKIKAGNGTAKLKTVAGEELTLTMDGDKVKVAGMGGSTAWVSQADVMQSNGVVHVVDGVLTPTL